MLNGMSSSVLWSTSGSSTGGLLTGGRVGAVVAGAGLDVGGEVVEAGATVVGGDVVELAGVVAITGARVVVERAIVEVDAPAAVVVLDAGPRVVGAGCVDGAARGFELQPPAPATSSRTSAVRKQRTEPPPTYLQCTPKRMAIRSSRALHVRSTCVDMGGSFERGGFAGFHSPTYPDLVAEQSVPQATGKASA
jgi:hypothetical protein